MKIHNSHIIRALTVSLLGCLTAISCGDSNQLDGSGVDPGQEGGNVYVTLSLGFGTGMPSTRVAHVDDEPHTPGTAPENHLQNLTMFVYDTNTDGSLILPALTWRDIDNPDQLIGKDYKFTITNKTTTPKKVFFAANLTEEQIANINENGVGATLSSPASDYRDVINVAVPGSDGRVNNVTDNGIIMTGNATDEKGDESLQLIGHTEQNPLKIKVDLRRIVAKMLLLSKTRDFHAGAEELDNVFPGYDVKGETYAPFGYPVSDKIFRATGWVRMRDIKFVSNATNKSTYIFPQANNEADPISTWKDQNMTLPTYDEGNMQDPAHFVYYNNKTLHQNLVADQAGTERPFFMQADSFNETTLNNTIANKDVADRYTNGIYCLENYFNRPSGADAEKFSNDQYGLPMVTQMSIAIKMTPKYLVIEDDYRQRMKAINDAFAKGKAAFEKAYPDLTYNVDYTQADVDRWKAISTDKYYTDQFGDTRLHLAPFWVIRAKTEADAHALLTWSLKFNKMWSGRQDQYERSKFPDDTFWSYLGDPDETTGANGSWYRGYYYLTAGAATHADDKNNIFRLDAVQHIGGWGYYYTYLTNTPGSNVKVPYDQSQVTRNTYYLITINRIATPGGSITRPEYIKVNTQAVNWVYDGRADVELH